MLKVDEKTSIDTVTIDGLKEIMEDDFDKLIFSYIEHTEELLEGMVSKIDSNDVRGLSELSHNLKSSSGNIGALLLAEISSQLETITREDSMEGVEELLENAQVEFLLVKKALGEML